MTRRKYFARRQLDEGARGQELPGAARQLARVLRARVEYDGPRLTQIEQLGLIDHQRAQGFAFTMVQHLCRLPGHERWCRAFPGDSAGAQRLGCGLGLGPHLVQRGGVDRFETRLDLRAVAPLPRPRVQLQEGLPAIRRQQLTEQELPDFVRAGLERVIPLERGREEFVAVFTGEHARQPLTRPSGQGKPVAARITSKCRSMRSSSPGHTSGSSANA